MRLSPIPSTSTTLDGENQHGNCEESGAREKSGTCEEGCSGSEKSGTCKEGRSGGQEGSTREEGGREEGRRPRQEAYPQRRLHEGDDPERSARCDHRPQAGAPHRGDEEG